MAAYAALVSLKHMLIDQIKLHPNPPVSIDLNQEQSLIEYATFFQDFLELYSHVQDEELHVLQSRMADAAYAAEDVIESHIADQIHPQSTSTSATAENISFYTADLYQDLQKVIQDMDLIKKEVVVIQQKMVSLHDIQQRTRTSMPVAHSSRSPHVGNNVMVGFEDLLIQLMDKLTGQGSNRQIIPITGMGGIGKTTLAKTTYEHLGMVHHFDIRAWATISQEYSVEGILLQLLEDKGSQESLNQTSDAKLGERLHKKLWGRRYLVIIDDIWSIEAWERVNSFFPDNTNGSRIIITSRLSNLALRICNSHSLEMNFLSEELSWNLLCKIVFGENGCPLELEEIGRKIAKKCNGLPLSIVVIGGLLAKSNQTREYWEYIAQHLNSIVNLEDDERCLKLLHTSYNHLPVHLKPCFLYMGVFPEDKEVRASELIKLWVAEGFLKPIIGKSLEKVAKEYLKDLIGRNLILIPKSKSNGIQKLKFCQIHDLLRDLCLREADKEKFICVAKIYGSVERIKIGRRTAIHKNMQKYHESYCLPQIRDSLQSASVTRSVISYWNAYLSPNCRLLRVFKGAMVDQEDTSLRCAINLRYLDLYHIPISLDIFWNLQTLIADGLDQTIEIWKMPLLRHVDIEEGFYLPEPPYGNFVLGNLQTLSMVSNFRCSEETVKMIPNIKKLRLAYSTGYSDDEFFCLNLLHKLENLKSCYIDGFEFKKEFPSLGDPIPNITFPHNLKKLTLDSCTLNWEDISTTIGSLPLLQVLNLFSNDIRGLKWKTVDSQFPSLKTLLIEYWGMGDHLKRWITNNTHFPCLEHLVLQNCRELKEIPLCIGDIPTLQSIELFFCNKSAVLSAKAIAEEQDQIGNDYLKVKVKVWNLIKYLPLLKEKRNFEVMVFPWLGDEANEMYEDEVLRICDMISELKPTEDQPEEEESSQVSHS